MDCLEVVQGDIIVIRKARRGTAVPPICIVMTFCSLTCTSAACELLMALPIRAKEQSDHSTTTDMIRQVFCSMLSALFQSADCSPCYNFS
jgi:hypothetical protein